MDRHVLWAGVFKAGYRVIDLGCNPIIYNDTLLIKKSYATEVTQAWTALAEGDYGAEQQFQPLATM